MTTTTTEKKLTNLMWIPIMKDSRFWSKLDLNGNFIGLANTVKLVLLIVA